MRDLEIVNEFITLYSKAFQGNPIGLNEDITSVLTGNNYTKGILFPPNSPMIVRGQLVDRWGTPYWFHPSSASQMEIRSAGPDKDLAARMLGQTGAFKTLPLGLGQHVMGRPAR